MKWPEIVIVLMTWCGPPEFDIADIRLRHTEKSIERILEHLVYPNYTWHIADDNSGKEYQQKVFALMPSKFTFSNTRIGGDVGENINRGLRVAYKRSDIVLLWHDDRFLQRTLNLCPCVQLLSERGGNVGLVRLKPKSPAMDGNRFERHGEEWWVISPKSRCAHVVDIGPHIIHKRFTDYYGLYPVGLKPNRVDDWIDNRFRQIKHGPSIVCPDSRWQTTEIPWGSHSTWERTDVEHD